MSSVVQKLTTLNENHINPPAWLPNNMCYEVIMGSRAYGVNQADDSDYDMYGFCIPPKHIVFPHLAGNIYGFRGWPSEPWGQWQQHHINVESWKKSYDFSIYNIVKYFQLCLENNPNMIDSLFVPVNCIVYITNVAAIVRDNRKLFLSKLVWKKFKGYAFAQLHKMDNKEPQGKRVKLVEKFGYDVKFGYHIFRLMNEAQQILQEGDLDLLRSREELKSIRRGEWTEERLKKEFENRLSILENIHAESKLRDEPDEQIIKNILFNCLEEHYGYLGDAVVKADAPRELLREVYKTLKKAEHIIYEAPTPKS